MNPGAPAPAVAPSRGRRAFQWVSLFAVVAIPLVAIVWLALPRPGCACTPTPTLPTSPVEGVVISVDARSITQVNAFDLRMRSGVVYTFTMGVLENATSFSPSHLAEHMASSQPVRVFYRFENGAPTVYRLEDATG